WVTTARVRTEVWDVSKRSPASAITVPAALASASPWGVRGTSCQPVKRFSRFHVLWPWRRMTSVPGIGARVGRSVGIVSFTNNERGDRWELGDAIHIDLDPDEEPDELVVETDADETDAETDADRST